MATVAKRRTLVNPGRRRRNRGKRKMTAKQIRFFGTKRQRAALRSSGKRKRRRRNPSLFKRASRAVGSLVGTRKRRRRRKSSNVGEIITIGLSGANPGTRKRRSTRVAKRRKRRVSRARPVRRRRRRNVAVVNPRRRRRRNYGVRRRRRTNYGIRRRRGHRRNPGMLSGRFGQVAGVIGGATVTGFICNTLVPVGLRTGIVGYLSTAAVAMLQGTVAGKFLKSSKLGADMTLGGFVYLGLKIANDLVPSLAAASPIGLRGRRGVGLIVGGNNFVLPRVLANNSLTRSYMRAVPAQMSGLAGRGLSLARRTA